jgi:integrase
VTFKEYTEAWAAVQPWRPTTRRRVDSAIRTHLVPALGARPIGNIRPTEVQAFVTRLSRTHEPSTVRTTYALLRSVFKAAVRDRVIAASPCVGVALPASRRKAMTVPTITDVRAISAALPARYRVLPFMMAGLGLRRGEALGLKVECIDFLRRVVTVEEQLDEAQRLVPLKTTASYRTIPLPDALAVMLTEHIRATGARTEGLVLLSATGGAVKSNSIQKTWADAAARAKRPGMRMHDMRHAYASALIDAGESIKVVQERLGHASATITLDVYGHLFPTSDERTRSAVDAFLAGPTEQDADSLRTAAASSQVSGGFPDYLEKS